MMVSLELAIPPVPDPVVSALQLKLEPFIRMEFPWAFSANASSPNKTTPRKQAAAFRSATRPDVASEFIKRLSYLWVLPSSDISIARTTLHAQLANI
jgi:hypothetical protein